MGLALVPFCTAFPMDSLLLFPGIGAFGFVALFIAEVLQRSELAWPRGARLFARFSLVLHGPLAAALLVTSIMLLPAFGEPFTRVVAKVPTTAAAPQQTFIFVNGLDFFVAYLPVIRELEMPAAAPRRV